MHLMGIILLKDMIETFRDAYQDFLKTMNLPDEDVVKVGFYTGVIEMIKLDPIPAPDPEVQVELLKYLEICRKTALGDRDDDLISSIHVVCQDAGARQHEKRHKDIVFIGVKKDDWNDWLR
jgi:hypothetical protein